MASNNLQVLYLINPETSVKIPVYSNIKLVDGEVVGELEGFEELPAELLPIDDDKH